LKKAAGHKIARTHSPKFFWDYYLDALIQSHTASNYHELNGQVPETITLLRQTADISALASYDWMKYWDLKAPFQDPRRHMESGWDLLLTLDQQ